MAETPPRGTQRGAPAIGDFLVEPTRDLGDWRWLWREDRGFPIRSHRGPLGRLIVAWKRLFRPLVKVPQNDLWERQRVFNLILLEHLAQIHENRRIDDERIGYLEALGADGIRELMRHNDALFARADQKLDRYRREVRDLLGSLGGALARVEQAAQEGPGRPRGLADVAAAEPACDSSEVERSGAPGEPAGGQPGASPDSATATPASDPSGVRPHPAGAPVGQQPAADRGVLQGAASAVESLARAREEHAYFELERRYRGTEEEIRQRIASYLPFLAGRSPVLDLGCGRGEALALLSAHGIAARGIDSSGRMVALCRERGLEARAGDAFEELAALPEASLGGVVSFHVIEHLPAPTLDRLVRLAHRALRPGGVLILETPSPLSLVVSARNFWLDPTHLRPVHPESLELLYELAGFDPVQRLDLRPFPAPERLPEIALATLPPDVRPLADHVNRLRDHLDELLFGTQDYGLIGTKPR